MKTDQWISICRITGLGESEYQAVRFANYSIDNGMITPDVEVETPATLLPRRTITGQKLLSRLYSLYETINEVLSIKVRNLGTPKC